LPGVSTLKEAGIDVEADAWMGLIAPAGMTDANDRAHRRLVGEAVTSRAIREKLTTQLMEPIPIRRPSFAPASTPTLCAGRR